MLDRVYESGTSIESLIPKYVEALNKIQKLEEDLKSERKRSEMYRKQLGGMTAAHNRAKQKIKDLESKCN